ncbi:MAG TPA: hypothetical protein VK927_03455 [Adhaeribacter sp.]|nr:hypothetical protein [Adhaeribacter sp.]
MSYFKLDEVTEEHLEGFWRVKSRQMSLNSVGNIFADFKCIRFQKKSFTARNGKRRKGTWEIIREQEVIYNPQVKFHIGKTVIINSIITNLMEVSSTGLKLILYFDTGLELVLEKEKDKDLCKVKPS